MVWSDKKIKELSREFVTVADEVYLLYPEDPGNLARVAQRPEHLFFKKFGEAMPAGDWNHPGTKQGIYMIGPDGEYLEGRFAAGSEPEDIRERLQRALERWRTLRREKGYKNRPVPAVPSTLPPGFGDADWVLRVNSRDLPRGATKADAVRFDPKVHGRDGSFLGFLAWAWNENWVAVDAPAAFVPQGRKAEPVNDAVLRDLLRRALIDNVRGQAGDWPAAAIVKAALQVREEGVAKGVSTLVYEGEFELVDGARSFAGKLYGRGLYRRAGKQFERFELLALGVRRGAHPANQREQDLGPAPLGIAMTLYQPEPDSGSDKVRGSSKGSGR